MVMCFFLLLTLFLLNYFNEITYLKLPPAISFSFLNTLVGGVLTSALVGLITETVSYVQLKKNSAAKLIKEYQREYFMYRDISLYIEKTHGNPFIYLDPVFQREKKIFESINCIRDIDFFQIFKNNYYKTVKESYVRIRMFFCELEGIVLKVKKSIDYKKSYIGMSSKDSFYSAESIRELLEEVKACADRTCEEIDKFLLVLDCKKTAYWKKTKEHYEKVSLDVPRMPDSLIDI